MDWKTLFLSARGRITRREFWLGFVIVMAVSIVVDLIPGPVGKVTGLLLLWPQVCVHAKRLHDMGRTAWLMLIPGLFTVLFLVVAAMTGAMGADSAAGLGHPSNLVVACLALLIVVVGVGFLLWVGLTKGTPGPNVYGEPPARKSAA